MDPVYVENTRGKLAQFHDIPYFVSRHSKFVTNWVRVLLLVSTVSHRCQHSTILTMKCGIFTIKLWLRVRIGTTSGLLWSNFCYSRMNVSRFMVTTGKRWMVTQENSDHNNLFIPIIILRASNNNSLIKSQANSIWQYITVYHPKIILRPKHVVEVTTEGKEDCWAKLRPCSNHKIIWKANSPIMHSYII
jgi:hypothetical protein